MNDDDVTSDASSDQNGGGLYHVTHDTSSVLSDLDSSSNFNSVFEVNSDFSAGANSEFNFERNPDDDVSSSSRSHSGGGIYAGVGAESDSGCGGSDERRVTHARTAHPCLAELATVTTLQQPKDHAPGTSIDCHSNVSVRLAKTRFDNNKCQHNAAFAANATTASCSDYCSMTEKHKQFSASDFNTKWDRKITHAI